MKKMNNDKQMRSDWSLKVCQGKERLKNSDNKTLHSTQKPEELLYRIILASTKTGDMVLDPFWHSFWSQTRPKINEKNDPKFNAIVDVI